MNPPNEKAFSSGFELGDVVLASRLPHLSLAALINDDSTQNTARILSSSNVSLPYKICDGNPKYRIIAFGGGVAGEPSSKLSSTTEANLSDFHFLGVKEQQFCINTEALSLFHSLRQHEDLFKKCSETMESKKTLIITGHSRGGWVASLLCLWLLQNRESADPASLPICITFGSPVLGDGGFSKAIQVRPLWKSRFLHVASYGNNLIPRTFLSEKTYKPFGTYLLCSSTGCACFDHPDSVLQVLETTTESAGPSQMPNSLMDYENLLKHLTHQMILSNSTGASQPWALSDDDPLRAGLTLQLDAIGVQRNQRDSFITNMVKEERENYEDNVNNASERQLNEFKRNMAELEWYKKLFATKMGYYDRFKSGKDDSSDTNARKCRTFLTIYWKEVVEKAVTKPPMRQLEAGTTYRRMVEPLDIAEYYGTGNTDYRNKGRANHYKVLEDWQEKKQQHNKRTADTLTEDSCFWADVEEAMILTNSVKSNLEAGIEPAESDIANLTKFEKDVMGLINRLAVSPEIFLKESTFMKWWNAYVIIPIPIRDGNSPLSKYMNEGGLTSM